MFDANLRQQITRELSLGHRARQQGLEGKARVCARRAVAFALRHYFSQRQPLKASLSVVDLIEAYQQEPGLSQALEEICSHLLTRVDPDYNLPIQADLLSEAQILIEAVLETDSNHDRSD